jgi:primosomal protein N'
MPDWRTIVNLQDKYGYTMDQALWSQHTSLQDIRQFWKMKHGQSELLICTPSECFWDYHDLSQITLIDPHKRYYKSQQDPRYDIMRVCELMAHYYDCELVTNT